METLTIYSIGDGAYLAQILQGVALMSTSGSLAALGLIGALAGLIAIGFSVVREGKMNPGPLFLGVFLFLALFVPRVPVIITDYFAGPGRSTVQADVPVGIALTGSLISHVGVGIADVTKTVYSYPGMERVPPTFALQNLLNLRTVLYGSRQRSQVMEAAESTLVEYTKSCVKPFLGRNETGTTGMPYVSPLHAADLFDATRYPIPTLNFAWKGPWSDTSGAPSGMPARADTLGTATYYTCPEGAALIQRLMNELMVPQTTQQLTSEWAQRSPEGFVNADQVIGISMRALQYESVNAQTIMRNVIMARALQLAESKHAIESQNVATAILVEGGLQQRNIQQASETAFFVTNLRQLMTLFEGVVYSMAPFAALFLATGTAFAMKAIGTYVMTLVWIMTWLPIMAVVNLFTLLVVRFQMNALIPPGMAPPVPGQIPVVDAPPITSVFGMLEIQHSAEQWIAFSGLAGSMVIAIAGMMVFRGVAAFGSLAQRATGGDYVNESAVAPSALETGPLMRQAGIATGTSAGGLEASGMAQMTYSLGTSARQDASSAASQASTASSAAVESVSQAVARNVSAGQRADVGNSANQATGTEIGSSLTTSGGISGSASSTDTVQDTASTSAGAQSNTSEVVGLGANATGSASETSRASDGTGKAAAAAGAMTKALGVVKSLAGMVQAGTSSQDIAQRALQAAEQVARQQAASEGRNWDERTSMSAAERASYQAAATASILQDAGIAMSQGDVQSLQRSLEARYSAEERFQESSALASSIDSSKQWRESDLASQILAQSPQLANELVRNAEHLAGNAALLEQTQAAARAMGVDINDRSAQVAGALRALDNVGRLGEDRDGPAGNLARGLMIDALRFDAQASGPIASSNPFANQGIAGDVAQQAASVRADAAALPGPGVQPGQPAAVAAAVFNAAEARQQGIRDSVEANTLAADRPRQADFQEDQRAQLDAARLNSLGEHYADQSAQLGRWTSGPTYEQRMADGITIGPMTVGLGQAADGSATVNPVPAASWVNENREAVQGAVLNAMGESGGVGRAFAETPEAQMLSFLTGVHATQPTGGERPFTESERETYAGLRNAMVDRFDGNQQQADLAISAISSVAAQGAENGKLNNGVLTQMGNDVLNTFDLGVSAAGVAPALIDNARNAVAIVGDPSPVAVSEPGAIAPMQPEHGTARDLGAFGLVGPLGAAMNAVEIGQRITTSFADGAASADAPSSSAPAYGFGSSPTPEVAGGGTAALPAGFGDPGGSFASAPSATVGAESTSTYTQYGVGPAEPVMVDTPAVQNAPGGEAGTVAAGSGATTAISSDPSPASSTIAPPPDLASSPPPTYAQPVGQPPSASPASRSAPSVSEPPTHAPSGDHAASNASEASAAERQGTASGPGSQPGGSTGLGAIFERFVRDPSPPEQLKPDNRKE